MHSYCKKFIITETGKLFEFKKICRFVGNFNLLGNEAVLGTNISTESASSSTLTMEAGGFSKMLVCIHQPA